MSDIPRVPTRPTHDSDGFSGSEQESGSDEERIALPEPVVPKRPNRSGVNSPTIPEPKAIETDESNKSDSKPSESISDHSEPSLTAQSSSSPQIRPSPLEEASSLSHVPLIPARPLKRPSTLKSVAKVEESAESAESSTQSEETPSSLGSALLPEQSSQEAELNSVHQPEDLDGDRTPGNSDTKASFKHEDESLPASGASSFDDDVETVSQEKEDEVQRQIEHDREEEELVEKEKSSGMDAEQITQHVDETEKFPEVEGDSTETVEAAPIIPRRPAKSSSDSLPLDSPLPSIPKRPRELRESEKVEKTVVTENSDTEAKELKPEIITQDEALNTGAKVVEGEVDLKAPAAEGLVKQDVEAQKLESQETSPIADGNLVEESKLPSKAEAEDEATLQLAEEQATSAESSEIPLEPAVPKRPTKKDQTDSPLVKPSIPARPERKQTPEPNSISEDSAPRAPAKVPPPKPKKLSSKIAAFQQMFNQEKPAAPSAPSTKARPSFDSGRKLSNDKMKFAESLRGVMGRGVPMPGMVNPNILRPSEEKEDESKEEEGQEDGQQSNSDVIKPIVEGARRTKGPKGKRLPKGLQDVKVETQARFQIATHDLWELKFEKETHVVAEPGTSDEVLADSKSEVLIEEDEELKGDLPKNEILEGKSTTEDSVIEEPAENSLETAPALELKELPTASTLERSSTELNAAKVAIEARTSAKPDQLKGQDELAAQSDIPQEVEEDEPSKQEADVTIHDSPDTLAEADAEVSNKVSKSGQESQDYPEPTVEQAGEVAPSTSEIELKVPSKTSRRLSPTLESLDRMAESIQDFIQGE